MSYSISPPSSPATGSCNGLHCKSKLLGNNRLAFFGSFIWLIFGGVIAFADEIADMRIKAEKGEAQAQWELGSRYRDGKGVAKDQVEAVKWYRKAAAQEYILAEVGLGGFYEFGIGVPKDPVEAFKWYRKVVGQQAVKQLDRLALIIAQTRLGYCYHKGEGVEQDSLEAVKWWRKSAEQGDDTAQYWLAFCYQIGSGVTKDYRQAYKWYNLSADQGNETSAKVRADYEKGMTPAQIQEARTLAKKVTP